MAISRVRIRENDNGMSSSSLGFPSAAVEGAGDRSARCSSTLQSRDPFAPELLGLERLGEQARILAEAVNWRIAAT